MVVIGKALMVSGGVSFACAMLFLTILGLRRKWSDFWNPDAPTWWDLLKRDTFEPLRGIDAKLAQLALPMFAIGIVLICVGILLQ